MEENKTALSEGGFLQSNKIKLTKNSRGYTWEITELSHDVEKVATINQKMLELFGSGE